MIRLAFILLAAGWTHQGAHAWLYRLGWISEAQRGHVWNITGALFLALVLLALGCGHKSAPIWIACAVLIGQAAQVGGCSAAYLIQPWPVDAGASLCSEGAAGPLAALGVVGTVLIARRYVSAA